MPAASRAPLRGALALCSGLHRSTRNALARRSHGARTALVVVLVRTGPPRTRQAQARPRLVPSDPSPAPAACHVRKRTPVPCAALPLGAAVSRGAECGPRVCCRAYRGRPAQRDGSWNHGISHDQLHAAANAAARSAPLPPRPVHRGKVRDDITSPSPLATLPAPISQLPARSSQLAAQLDPPACFLSVTF